jgi:hypothetical protein
VYPVFFALPPKVKDFIFGKLVDDVVFEIFFLLKGVQKQV